MDIATIIGVSLGFLVVVGSIVAGGMWQAFIHIPSLALTVGGMLCATMIHFSLPQFLGIFSVVKKTIVTKIPPPSQLIQNMVNFAAINRRDGALALEQEIEEKGVEADGYVYEEIGECLLALGREAESKKYFKLAYDLLSKDEWLKANQADRLKRLAKLSL